MEFGVTLLSLQADTHSATESVTRSAVCQDRQTRFCTFESDPTHFLTRSEKRCDWHRFALLRGVWFGIGHFCSLHLEERTFMCCFQETGLYEYKIFGVLSTCTPELCADVYMDLTYRKDWDGYAKGKIKQTIRRGSYCHCPCVRAINQLSLISPASFP